MSRTFTHITAVALGAMFLATAVIAADPAAPAGFAKKPAVTRSGDKTTIEFAVDRQTDVAVYVLDSQGKVVRHLAAGVLGGQNPPPPPLKAGLAQSIEWDGKDDAGRTAGVGGQGSGIGNAGVGGRGSGIGKENPTPAFSVRVRVGMKPQFDGFLLYQPDAYPETTSLAVGPKGELYVFYRDPTANGNQGGHKIRVITREGKFVRQILPFPADLPYEKVKATGAFQDADGSLVPNCHNWHSLSFYPDTVATRGRSMSDFSQPVVDGNGRLYWIITGGRLCAIDADGGVPYDTFLSEPLFPGVKNCGGKPTLAMSSDGKYLYASGISQADDSWGKNTRVIPCVWRIDVTTRKPEVFIGSDHLASGLAPSAAAGSPDQATASNANLTGPRGIAVAGGLVYVADPEAGRVAVFKEADRSFVSQIKCVLPNLVQVHPKTGEVYVCSYVPEKKPQADGKCRITDARLLKFPSYKNATTMADLPLPRTGLSPNDGTHRIVLDTSADQPVIWTPGLPYSKTGKIGCYRDAGNSFEQVKLAEPAGPWGDGPRDLLVDRSRGELYVKVQGERWHQFDDKTGQFVRTVAFPKNDGGPYSGSSGSQLGVLPSGDYITHCWGEKAGLMRWTRDLKPLKWDSLPTHRSDWGGMMTFQLKYMSLLGDDIYVIKPVQGAHSVEVYDQGLNVKRRVVWNARRGSCVRVDNKGNVYMTVPLRPADRDFDPFFDGKLEKLPDYYNNIGAGIYWYAYMAGAIVKFPAEGGAFHWTGDERAGNDLTGLPEKIAAAPKAKFQYFLQGHYPHKTCEVQNAAWVRFGCAPYAETYGAGTPVCMCEGSGFDVDAFGRVFHTNLFRFRVEVADNNNNTIAQFGQYGNQDSGPAGRVKTPSIPLAWPTYVAVSDDYAYVNDTVGMRVVRVKLASSAEETCEVK